jgi:hypothetical protein
MSLPRAVFELFIPDNRGQRAFEETLADWRHAESAAGTPLMRLWTGVQGLVSLVRVAVLSARWQVVDRHVWRVFAWTVLASGIGSVLLMLPVFSSQAPLATMASLLLPSMFAFVFPVAGSIGVGTRREAAVPLVGQMVAAAVVMFLLLGWAVPVANARFVVTAYSAFSQVESSGSPIPMTMGMAELTLPKVVAAWRSGGPSQSAAAARHLRLSAALTIAAPTFLLLGVAIRRRWIPRGSWRLAQVAGGAAAIAAVVAGEFAARLLGPGNPMSLASGTGLWLTLLAAWLMTALVVGTTKQAGTTLVIT